jgi:hypothetical protein
VRSGGAAKGSACKVRFIGMAKFSLDVCLQA